jgi:hypothetical protein
VSAYDDDAGRLAEPCGNCGLPNYECSCDGDDEPCGSCEACGGNLYPEDDYYDGALCDQCQWYSEHGGEA